MYNVRLISLQWPLKSVYFSFIFQAIERSFLAALRTRPLAAGEGPKPLPDPVVHQNRQLRPRTLFLHV
jgi:hypothetical protein